MSSLVQLGIGTVFAGDFKVLRPLTEGGMGAVYVAEQVSTGKQRALKIMHPQLLHDATMRQRFVQEAKIGARIESDHVVEVVSAGIDAATNTPWMVMELLLGETLESFIETKGPCSKQDLALIFSQLCHAVGAAHDVNIVHRDLKPENIFLTVPRREGVPFVVKVLDFGIAKLVAEADTRSTQAIGSPLWMAPEQAQTGSLIAPSTDVWSLGLVAFWMLTGLPFWRGAQDENPNPMKLMLEVCFEAIPRADARARDYGVDGLLPEGFSDWFGKCVVREPEGRFANARAARVALEALIGTPKGTSTSGSHTPASGVSSPGPTSAKVPRTTGGFAATPIPSPQDVPDLPEFTPIVAPPPAKREPPRVVLGALGTAAAAGGGGAPPPAPVARQGGLSARDREVLASINSKGKKSPSTTTSAVAASRAASRTASEGLPIGKIVAGVLVVLAGLGVAQRLLWTGKTADSPKRGDPDPAAATAVASVAKAAPLTCSSAMLLIPGGTFSEHGASSAVDAFCIDKTEVTVDAYAACVKSAKCKPAYASGNMTGADASHVKNLACNVGRRDRAEHPINCVEWAQAVAYCDAQGAKLPTEAQWEWAARGGKARTTYPWGNASPTAGQLCWSAEAKRTSTCPVGKMERGLNPFGVADLEGNVREWTTSTTTDTEAVLCGTDWSDASAESLHPFGYCGTEKKGNRSALVGFRCVKGP